VFVQTLIAKFPVEAFDVRVLVRMRSYKQSRNIWAVTRLHLKYGPLRAKLARLGTQEYGAMIQQYQTALGRAREFAERGREVVRKNELPSANQITSLGNAWVDVQLTAQALSLIVGTLQAPFSK